MAARNITFLLAMALIGLALAIGGAGQNFPLLEMLLDLCALAGAAMLLWRGSPQPLTRLSRAAVALMACVLLLPVLQLVPLPPSVWQALPGRGVVVEIDSALHLNQWRPLTLDVEGTIRAVLNLIPACVVFVACLRLRTADRRNLLLVVAAFALVNALLGIVQLASGGSMTPYPSAHLGYPLGLFVNRNHNAVFLLMSMPMLAALAAPRMQASKSKGAYLAGALAVLTILAIVVIATTSRMALALLPFVLGGSLALLFFRQSIARVAIPSLLVIGAVAAVISWVGGLSRNLARFSSLHDGRFDYWDDVSWALHHYGLAGTGFGTFIPVYQTAESLSSVAPAVLNHAHNDFIEIVLEGGIPAIILLFAFFVIAALAAVEFRRRKFDFHKASLSFASALGIGTILVFSLVDYPLRMPALSCVFALLFACLLPTPLVPAAEPSKTAAQKRAQIGGSRPRIRKAVATVALLLVALIVVQAGVSEAALLSDDSGTAASWASWSTAAGEAAADDALASSRPVEARANALHTLALSPIDAVALRTVAMTEAMAGSAEQSQALMEIAVSLGWRDPFTQVWAIGASEQTGAPDKAVQRAQALFQQHLFFPSATELLLRDAPDGPTARGFRRLLGSGPPWREAFLRAAAQQLPDPYVASLAGLLSGLDGSSSPVSPGEMQPMLQRLVHAGDLPVAQRLWMSSVKGLLANGGFEQLSARNGLEVPTGWDISDEDLATIAVQAPDFGGHGRALRISASARSGPILSQALLLPPGSYSLAYRARSGGGAPADAKWTFRCAQSGTLIGSQQTSAPSKEWQSSAMEFTVPVQDCPIQRLALERPGDIRTSEIWVDEVSIARRPG